MTTVMDKDRLAAFVDGELTPEEAAEVAMHLADHPADQAWVDDLYAANEALARAFAAPLEEPVPEAIRQAILGPDQSVVVPFRPRRGLIFGGMGLAASLVAAALLVPGLTGDPQSVAGIALGPVPGGDAVAMLLDTGTSGVVTDLADGRTSMVLASFAMPDGRFCREFEVVDAKAGRVDFAVGCHSGGTWTVEVAIAEASVADPQGGFVPAGSTETDALLQFLQRSGDPQMLDPAAEAEAIRLGWTAR